VRWLAAAFLSPEAALAQYFSLAGGGTKSIVKTKLIAATLTRLLAIATVCAQKNKAGIPRRFLKAVIFGGLFVTLSLARAGEIPFQQVEFAKGTHGATLKGSITGSQVFDYRLRARAGQTMTIELKSDRTSEYFNLVAPGRDEALFIGPMRGSRFEGQVPVDGEYNIRLYLMGGARDSGKTANHTLHVEINDQPGNTATPFDKTLSLQGISFHVQASPAAAGSTRIVVTPTGLGRDNSPVEATIDGGVTDAEVEDLNADGSPEIYIYGRASDASARASLTAWSANRKLSLTPISLPKPAADDPNFSGCKGHDEFAVVENILARRFPVGGKTRQIQYKLHRGEATWVLKVDRVVEY
jgi:hypothetical protein